MTPLQRYVITTMDLLKTSSTNFLDDILSKQISIILKNIDKQTDWISSLKQHFRLKLIESNSLFGTTLKGCLRDPSLESYQIVVKTASEESETYTIRYEFDILHEVIIGFALNSLHSQCFAAMIGYLFKKQGNAYHALNVQAYIQGHSLINLMKKQCPPSTYLHIFVQLAHALDLAQTKFQFMHWDLHGENVICMPLVSPQTITCTFSSGETITLEQVAYIPVMIDFGLSTMIVNSKFVPNKYFASEPPKDDESQTLLWSSTSQEVCPLFDLYRYITYCFVKSPHFPSSILPNVFSYLHKMNKQQEKVLDQSLRLIEAEKYEEYRTFYTKNKCTNPHKDAIAFFKAGSLVEWAKEMVK
jgi:hypothetical protein